jgi:hypothetical protein
VVGVPAVAVVAAAVVWLGWQAWSREWRVAEPGRTSGSAAQSGAYPFDRGERASYRVTWRVGSSGGLAAGRAVFDASGGGSSRYFSLDVETAAWAASLYEVRGRIESWTDAGLLPSRQEQHLRQGRRPTDRTTRFDWPARTFTVGDSRPLPLPPNARDGLSAWFYTRTLPLSAGYRVRVPVVEAGRTYNVDARIDRVERISLDGREAEAFRMALGVESAPDRREVARAVVWLSTDARRVPLALEFETSLGPFRAELDAYDRR